MVWPRGTSGWVALVVLFGAIFGCDSSERGGDNDEGGETGGAAGSGDSGGGTGGGYSGGRANGGSKNGGAAGGGTGGADAGGSASGGTAGSGPGGESGSAGAGSSTGGSSGAPGGAAGSAGTSAGRGGASGMGGMTAGRAGAGGAAGAGAGGAGGAMAGGGGSLGGGAAPNGQGCERGGLCASGHCVRGTCVAPPNWGSVQVLGTLTGAPSIVMPEFGRAAVAWNHDLRDQVYASVATSKTFGTAERIDTQTGSVYNNDPTVAHAGGQRYLITWGESDSASDYDVWARVHDGSWGTPIDVDGGVENMGNPNLATNASGNGMLIWQDRERVATVGKLVTGPTLGSEIVDFSYGSGRSVGVSPSGRIAVAWCLGVPRTSDLWVRTYTPGVGWAAPEAAWHGTPSASCDYTRVAINDAGEVMVTWESRIGVWLPMGAFRTTSGTWELDLLNDAPGSNSSSYPTPVFSASGALMVSWIWFDSTRSTDECFLHYRVRSGGRWTPVLEADACSGYDYGSALATYDYESFRLIYAKDVENTPGMALFEARYVGGKGIVERRMIAPVDPYLWGYRLALDTDGRGLLVWVYQEDSGPSAPSEVRAMWLE